MKHHPTKRPTTRIRKKDGRIELATQSVREEIRMASIETLNGEYKVKGVRRITANMTLLTQLPADTSCSYNVEFPAAQATPSKAIVSSITRVLPGGSTQANSVVVSATTGAGTFITIPLGVFPGRKVTYTVTDNAGQRRVAMTIASLDGSGVNESWRHQFAVILTPGDITNFDLLGPKGMTIDSVDITP